MVRLQSKQRAASHSVVLHVYVPIDDTSCPHWVRRASRSPPDVAPPLQEPKERDFPTVAAAAVLGESTYRELLRVLERLGGPIASGVSEWKLLTAQLESGAFPSRTGAAGSHRGRTSFTKTETRGDEDSCLEEAVETTHSTKRTEEDKDGATMPRCALVRVLLHSKLLRTGQASAPMVRLLRSAAVLVRLLTLPLLLPDQEKDEDTVSGDSEHSSSYTRVPVQIRVAGLPKYKI